MTELSGSLDGIGFPALIRFLGGLRKSGTLRLWQGGWTGEIGFDGGRVVTASLGPERGLAALEGLLLLSAGGRFSFQESAPPTEQTIAMTAEELDAYLTGLAAHAAQLAHLIPSLAAIPVVVPPPDPPSSGEQVTLDRGTLGLLLAIDGWRTVSELAAGRGLAGTLRALARLVALGLVRIQLPGRPAQELAPFPAAAAPGSLEGMVVPPTEPPPSRPAAAAVQVDSGAGQPAAATMPVTASAEAEAPRPAAWHTGAPHAGPFRYWQRALVLAMAVLLLMLLNWQLSPRVARLVQPQPVVPTMTPAVQAPQLIATAVPTPSPSPRPRLRILVDERFADPASGWPHDPDGPAWYADGVYRLAVRQAERFVAVSAPLDERLRDVAVTIVARKAGGPSWGGYGVIVRDQAPERRDGRQQDGRYLLFQVSDRGEVGVWRREDSQWIELMPWTPSRAVRTGNLPNELTVQAVGPQLSFTVNGVSVATLTDPAPADGATGIFVGGALNEVVVERFVLQVPEEAPPHQ
jgi:hypothetical protein